MDDFMKYSLFDEIIKEAEDDEGGADAGGEEAAAGDADTNGDGEVSDDEANAAATEEGDAADEDFDINTDIPEGDDEGGDDAGGDDTIDDTSSPDTSSPASDDEVKPANTNIFDTLTAEEQNIKIKELKKSYQNLYATIDDILNRINNMDIDEDTLDVMSRVTVTLYNLKDEIANYFINIFNLKSYLENDIKFNEFLAILKAVTVVVDELSSNKQKILGLDTTKSDKK